MDSESCPLCKAKQGDGILEEGLWKWAGTETVASKPGGEEKEGAQRCAREKTCLVLKANGFSAEEAEGADGVTKKIDNGRKGGPRRWVNSVD